MVSSALRDVVRDIADIAVMQATILLCYSVAKDNSGSVDAQYLIE